MLEMRTSTIRQAVSALVILILVTLFFTVTNDSVYSAPSNPKTISIAEARSLPLDPRIQSDIRIVTD